MANKKATQTNYHYTGGKVYISINKNLEDPVPILDPTINDLDRIKKEYEKHRNNRFIDSNAYISQAIDILVERIKKDYKTDINWLFYAIEDEGKKEGSREEKYTQEERCQNCAFVQMLVNRGSSETQAFKLLSKLRGDVALSEGTLRMLRDDYSAYKKHGIPIEEEIHDPSYESYRQGCIDCGYSFSKDITEFVDYLDMFGDFKYTQSIYKDDIKAYTKTLNALEALCTEIIELIMPENPDYFEFDDEFKRNLKNDTFRTWCKYKGSSIEKLLNNPIYKKTHKKPMIENMIGNFISPYVTLP